MKKTTLILCLVVSAALWVSCRKAAGPGAGQPAQVSTPQPAATAVSIPLSTPAGSPSPGAKGKAGDVPEIMKRPLTREEMEKALQAMPPEIRARIQGLGPAPPGVVPTPSPKKK